MKFSMVPGRCFRQLMDGWEGRGKLSWLRSCEVTSIYCWKMFVQENLKGKCKDKTSGFVGIWILLKENKIWPLHVYAFTFRIYLRIFCVFLDECLDQKSGFLKHVWLRQVTANQNYLRLLPTPFLHRGQAHHIDQKIVIPFCFISKTAPRKKQRPQFPAAFWGGKTPQQNGPGITSLLVSWGWVSASPTQIQVPWVQQRLSANWSWCWIEPWLIHRKNWGWHWHFAKDRWFWDPVWRVFGKVVVGVKLFKGEVRINMWDDPLAPLLYLTLWAVHTAVARSAYDVRKILTRR